MVFGKRLGGGDNHAAAPSVIQKVWNTICALFLVFSKTDIRPQVPVVIEGKTFLSLMDSGSGLTLMSYRAFQKLKPIPLLHKSRVRLTAANGGHLTVRGYAKLRYRLGSREVTRRTLIVQGLQTHSLIGVDTMAEENITLDHGERKVIMKPRPKREVGYTTKEFCVLPMAQKVISLVNTNLSEGLVLAKGPRVPEGVTELKNGRLAVKVQNNTMWPMKFSRGSEICAIRKIDAADLEPDKINARKTKMKPPRAQSRNLPDDTLNKILKDVPPTYKDQYKNLLRSYSDCIALTADEVGHCTVLKHHIELKNPHLISAQPPRRIAKHLFSVAKEFIDKMRRQGIIRPSKSCFSAPLMIVRKPQVPDDPNLPNVLKWRAVCDWRQLNSNTVPDKFPMRNLYELLDEVSNGKLYSVIDLANGFYSQELTESSKHKTAFSLPGYGHWEMCRSGMGLTNSPAAFQRLLEFITCGLQKVYVYIDDIAIVGQTHTEHLQQLKEVFERFRKYGLKARLTKLQIATASISYLGHKISAQHGIKPGDLKVKAIKNWQPPISVSQVREYLGLCGWYRRMVPRFSHIAQPLTALTRKTSTWSGGKLPPAAEKAFYQLRDILTSEPCLSPVDWTREMIVTCDGSAEGYGARLSFIDQNGSEKVCAYASRTTKPSEKNYHPFKMESNAILFACKTFRPYLLGKPFLVRTDHKPLENVARIRGPGLDGIYAQLQEFLPFRVEHYPGAKMQKCGVDGLSRGGANSMAHEMHNSKVINNPVEKPVLKPTTSPTNNSSRKPTKPVPTAKINLLNTSQAGRTIHKIEVVERETSLKLNWSAQNIKSLQTQDKYLKSLACYLAFGLKPDSRDLQRWVKVQAKSAVFNEDGILGIYTKDGFRILAPLQIRQTLLELSHDRAGHWGHKKMYEILRKNWTWPEMRQNIENYAKSCDKCQGANAPYNMKPVPLEPLPEATHFGARLHVDLIGKLPPSGEARYTYLLVCIDAFSGLVHLKPCVNKESSTIAQALIDGFFAEHGYCSTLNSDRGSEFCSDLMIALTKKLNIKRALSSSSHPISNGLAERANRSVIGLIRKTVESNSQWSELCPSLAAAINCAPHSTKRFSPFMIAFNRRPNLLVDLLSPKSYSEEAAENKLSIQLQMHRAVRDWAREAFERQKKQYDKRTLERTFLPKDIVWVTRPHSGNLFQKFQPKFMGGYQVVKKLSHNCYELVHLKTLRKMVVHVNRIKRGHFREQLYSENLKEEGTKQNLTQPIRKSSRLADKNREGILDDDKIIGGRPQVPLATPPSSSSPSNSQSHSQLNSETGSEMASSAQMSERAMSFQGEGEADLQSDSSANSQSDDGSGGGASLHAHGGHGNEHEAGGGDLSSPPSSHSSSSSNGTSQQKVPSTPLSAQQQSTEELEKELARVRERRVAIDRSLRGERREEGADPESSPQPPPPPPQRQTRTRRRPLKYFGPEWQNDAVYSF